jgi:hypothetical protein
MQMLAYYIEIGSIEYVAALITLFKFELLFRNTFYVLMKMKNLLSP